jgi:YlmC/YmxH family sporulation protein
MRLSDLGEKEIINIANGCRYGDLNEAELVFEEKTAKIKAILVPEHRSRLFFGSISNMIQIPWPSIKKIGEDIIIVETDI